MKTLLTFLLFIVALEFGNGQTSKPINGAVERKLSTNGSENKWMSIQYSNFGKIDSTNWIVYNPSNSGLPGIHVYAIAIDQSENKWLGCWYNGMAKFDGTNWTVYDQSNSGLPDNDITSIAIDENGYVWIATYGGGLATFNGTEWVSYGDANTGIFQFDYLYKVIIDENGNKWIGGYPGLVKYDGINFTVYNNSNTLSEVSDIAIDSNGNIWVSARNSGVGKFDGTDWTIYNTTNSGLPHNMTNAILVDDSGYVWIGTHNGLAKFDGENWTVYGQYNSGLPENNIASIAVDNYGNKWIGTWGGGLVKFDGANWTVYNTSNSSLPYDDIRDITIDENGNKWLSTSFGVIVFNENGVNSVDDESAYSSVTEFTLMQNYPNPFNPTTNITYVIAHGRDAINRVSTKGAVQVSLKVYDALGREVATLVNQKQAPGKYTVQFNAPNLPSGVYFYELQAGNFVQTRKMVLMK